MKSTGNSVWEEFVDSASLGSDDQEEFIAWVEDTYSENVFLTPLDRLNDLLEEWTDTCCADNPHYG